MHGSRLWEGRDGGQSAGDDAADAVRRALGQCEPACRGVIMADYRDDTRISPPGVSSNNELALGSEGSQEDGMSVPEAAPERYATRRLKRPARASFTCFQCGAQVSYDSDRCPGCKAFYIKDVRPEDVDELLRAEQARDANMDEIMKVHRSPLVHFDGELSLMRLLEDEKADPGFVSECSHCGTVVEVETDRCPMCGTPLDGDDEGLVGVFKDMEFDPAPFEEADCPFCGEHVRLESGSCPECGRALDTHDEGDPTLKVLPVLSADNVVFLHLDIETGEIDILQRNAARRRYDQASMFLDLADNGGHGRGRSGLSRS